MIRHGLIFELIEVTDIIDTDWIQTATLEKYLDDIDSRMGGGGYH